MVRVLVIILAVLVIAVGGGWWFYTTTPEYSLLQMSSAIKQRDVDTFGRYFDVHTVAIRAVDDLMSEPVREVGGQGLIERLLGAAAIGWLQPVVVGKLEDSIVNFVATHGQVVAEPPQPRGLLSSIVNALRPPSLSDVLRGLGFSSATYRGVGKVERNDKLAHTNLLFERTTGVKTPVEMELKQQPDNSWRVVRFSNLQKVLTEVRGSEAHCTESSGDDRSDQDQD